jgi:rhodanese-related sulfurtransferase
MKKLVALVCSLVFAASVYAADYPDISIGDLKTAMVSQKIVLLDANGTESWQSGHIPGALNFAAKKDDLTSVLPKDKNALVVAYCGNPQCPAYHAAADAAKKLGYTNIKHLVAGIQGWKSAGEKTEKGS